jgi:putative phosphoesterase
MRIGVLSDTHTSSLSHDVLEKLRSLNLDLIIHCGDYTDIHVMHQLKSLGNFCGVVGNMDSPEIKAILKEKEIIDVEGKRIGIFHGHGLFFANKKLENKFKGEKIDIYCYGHTHRMKKEKKNGIYYLNPGPFRESMLIVNLGKDKEIEVEVVRF